MKIKITLADIRKAKEERRKFADMETWSYSRSETCPLAFALKRLYPGHRVCVSVLRVYFGTTGERGSYLSKDALAFIHEADRKKDKIRPREVEIDIDAPTTKTTT